MKAKIRSIRYIIMSMVIILVAYLGYLNFGVKQYNNVNEVKSTANYIEVEEIEPEVIVEEIVVEPIVYDNKTMPELSETINASLSSTMENKGELIVTYSLEKGVDPYMATAIILHETGCKYGCSRIVRECNNVGGQKGSGCGSYGYFNTLDEGIKAFIDNLKANYIDYGLTTPEQINPKYAEDPTWSQKVNKYIEDIKAH